MSMQIGKFTVDHSSPVFIIAELSCNHRGSYEVAEETIRAVAEAGGDCIKLQTDTLLDGTGSTMDFRNEYFTITGGTPWDGRNLYDLYKETYTPLEWHKPLMELCHELGLVFLSTPYSPEAVDYLETLNVTAYKVASMEISDIPFIEYVASFRKPIILSTGMASYEDIRKAVDTCHKVGNNDIAILKSVSEYPTHYRDINLNNMRRIQNDFEVLVGISDHSPGCLVAIAATALGARIIEKHVILDKSLGGPDIDFSLDIHEFKNLVEEVRNTELALGGASYEMPTSIYNVKRKVYGRSLFVVRSVKKGETFTKKNIRSIRPGYGLPPAEVSKVLGKKASCDIDSGTPLEWNMII